MLQVIEDSSFTEVSLKELCPDKYLNEVHDKTNGTFIDVDFLLAIVLQERMAATDAFLKHRLEALLFEEISLLSVRLSGYKQGPAVTDIKISTSRVILVF